VRGPSLPDPLEAWLDDVRGWLDGRIDAGAFAALHGQVSAMVLHARRGDSVGPPFQ
jgi:hypothetical protein